MEEIHKTYTKDYARNQTSEARYQRRKKSMERRLITHKKIQEGLIQMCDANIALRHQLGAITAIVVSGQLFNERTNTQLEKILKGL